MNTARSGRRSSLETWRRPSDRRWAVGLHDPSNDRRAVARTAEQEPLAELAAELAQRHELRLILDPLRDNLEMQGSPEGDDGAGKCPRVGSALRFTDELVGDLQNVDLEPAQVPQRRVAGAEVVD